MSKASPVHEITKQLQIGMEAHQAGILTLAKTCYELVLQLSPENPFALHLMGLLAHQNAQSEAAIEWMTRAIVIKPDYVEAHSNLGVALKALGRLPEAIASYKKAIEIDAEYLPAHTNLGVVLLALQRYEEAFTCFERVIHKEPENANAFFNLALAQQSLGQTFAAADALKRAVQLAPDFDVAWRSLGELLVLLKQHQPALKCFQNSIDLQPNSKQAHINKASLLMSLSRYEEALVSFARAIELSDTPKEKSELLVSQGNALKELKQLELSARSFEEALRFNPSHEYLAGMVAYAKQLSCDWKELDGLIEQTEKKIAKNEKVSLPFVSISLTDDPACHHQAAMIFSRSTFPTKNDLGPIRRRGSSKKIRLAYYSADFYNHATAYLMAHMLELHDREKFEVVGFSFGGSRQDEMSTRIAQSFDELIDVSALTDLEVAKISREKGVDIAVDLKGFTKNARPGIFAYRCAPVQVNYLGYPGTMGADYFDYIIADDIVLPLSFRHHYSEKVAYLPNSYQVNDAKRQIGNKKFGRSELGLPESGFVFCCFNNSYKISADTFDDWCQILKAVQGSVLWLLKDSAPASNNLRHEASKRGVDPHRLVFAGRMSLQEHLARQQSADLFLDTLPVNAHTTASDALWAGLPLLTLPGQSFASRVAASLLYALDLAELVVTDRNAYIEKAIELATVPSKLQKIRSSLDKNRVVKPLFDTLLFTRNIEQAFMQMQQRALLGLEPDHIWVKSGT